MTKAEARQIRDAVEDAELPTDALYEIIDGRVVEVSGMGPSGCVIASRLASHLGLFTQRKRLGRLVFETLFRFEPTTYRRPNLAFVSYERWAKDAPPPHPVAWEVIPDLVVEVLYETDQSWDVLAKIHQYFHAGVRAVWLLYPNLEVFHIFDSFTQIRVLTRDDILAGGDVISGFQVPLSSVFENWTDEVEEAD